MMMIQLLISFLLVGTTVAFGGGKALMGLSFEQISEFQSWNRMGRTHSVTLPENPSVEFNDLDRPFLLCTALTH